MGDRACIQFRFTEDRPTRTTRSLYFYTHWYGSEVPAIVAEALARRARWEDPAYLTRIIVSRFLKTGIDDETGFGFSPWFIDSEYPNFEIDLDRNTVTIGEKTYTFDEFVRQRPGWPAKE